MVLEVVWYLGEVWFQEGAGMPRATLETEEVHLMVNEVQGKVVQVCHGEHLIGGEEGGEVAA